MSKDERIILDLDFLVISMFGVFQMTCLVPRRKIKSLRKRWKPLSRIFRTCKSKFTKSKPYCLSLARCEYIWIFKVI